MSSSTVATLKEQGYSLYGFKAVQASGGGAPLVWFKYDQDKLLQNTNVEWTESFSAYNSTSQIISGGQIRSNNVIDANLDDLITIDLAGNLSHSKRGVKRAISFLNDAAQQFTVGISQLVNGKTNELCAFPILGSQASRVITPITKIALIFSTDTIKTGTVITKAMSSGALIDLTGVGSREVTFDVKEGWGPKEGSWLTTFEAFTNMSRLLIESQDSNEVKLSEKLLEL